MKMTVYNQASIDNDSGIRRRNESTLALLQHWGRVSNSASMTYLWLEELPDSIFLLPDSCGGVLPGTPRPVNAVLKSILFWTNVGI